MPDTVYDLLCLVENKKLSFQEALYRAYLVGRRGLERENIRCQHGELIGGLPCCFVETREKRI